MRAPWPPAHFMCYQNEVEIGRVLAERYTIVRPLAEGAMATVWVAKDRTTDEEVAVKAISLDEAGWRAEVRDRFMKEARLLALAKHEHLVGVRDVGETDDGYLYLVLDLLDGETLADRIARDPPLDWKEAGRISLAITRGVAALHETGIVHRDLKPANVVLHRAGNETVPKIIDLGISKVRAAAVDPELCATLTATGQVLGTPQYMSSEQALGEPDVDARTDVWALGVILYEMLARRRPFEAPNANAVLAAIRRNDAPPLAEVAPSVPAPIARLVERCLAPPREERFKDAGEMADALLAALQASAADPTPAPPPPTRASTPDTKPAPPPALPPAPAPRSQFSSRTHKAPTPTRSTSLITGAIALLAAALLGATIAVVLTRPPPSEPPASTTKTSPPQPSAPPPKATPPSAPPLATTAPPNVPSATAAPVVRTTAPVPTPTSTPSARTAPTSTQKASKPITVVNSAGF